MTSIMQASKTFIFEDDRPFPSCHAATLIVLPDGDVLAAWFGGTREKANDVAIWLSRLASGVRAWSTPTRIADEEGIAHWNPVLFRNRQGDIYLYYKVGHEIPDWFTRAIVSRDGGYRWSEPWELVPGDVGGRGPVKNKPVELTDGTILAPASLETETEWDAFADISRDGGLSWEASAIVPLDRSSFSGKGIIQPTIWESAPGRAHMLLRSTDGAVYRSDSDDGGRTWARAYATSLPNNNSGIDLCRTDFGLLALVYNPISGDWAARTPLSMAFSADNGATWGDAFIFEHEPGEYSYPAIVADGSSLHIVYTWNRERIAYWKVTLAK